MVNLGLDEINKSLTKLPKVALYSQEGYAGLKPQYVIPQQPDSKPSHLVDSIKNSMRKPQSLIQKLITEWKGSR